MNVRLQVTGQKEIDQVLAGLSKLVTHRIMQAANAEAAKPLVEAEHLFSPVGKTGGLADSHGTVKQSAAKAAEIGSILVGPRRGRYKGHHAHLVNFGTQQRTNRAGANRGAVKATHYLEKAYDKTKNQVLGKISEFVGVKLYAFMKRTIKNYGS